MRPLKLLLLLIAGVYVLPAALSALLWWTGEHPGSWRQADWSSAQILPVPDDGTPAAQRAADVAYSQSMDLLLQLPPNVQQEAFAESAEILGDGYYSPAQGYGGD